MGSQSFGHDRETSLSFRSVLFQFSLITQSCLTLCDPMNHSTPGLPVQHHSRSPPKPVSIESVMPSNHPILCCPLFLLSSIFPSIRVFFKWVSSLHQVAKVLELQLQHQSFQWIFRTEHREVQLQIDRAVGGERSKTMEILVITNSKGGESFPGKGSI